MARALLAMILTVLLVGACDRVFAQSSSEEEAVLRSVRKIQGTTGQCSAVVIQPGVLLTAKHCLADGARYVMPGRVPVVKTVASVAVDGAVIYAPGVGCPCATLESAFAAGPVAAIGFPNGQQTVTGGAMIGYGFVGPAGAQERAIIHTAGIARGASGGGLFQRRGPRFVLVGILIGYNALSYAVFVGDIGGVPW